MTNLKKRIEPIGDLGSEKSEYDRDYAAILYSHAFRRLRHKTQVFFYSQNDHVCTRLDHALYVSYISALVCRNLKQRGIDCDRALALAIGIGHDVGHASFGHEGESILNELSSDIGGFNHESHGLRIVDKIEKPRDQKPVVGLNLTIAVRDGIINHSGEDTCTSYSPSDTPNFNGGSYPHTIEGCIVRLVDRIAYLGRDLEDAIITQLIKETDIPAKIAAIIGTKNGEIVDYFVNDLIMSTTDKQVSLSSKASKLMKKMMDFNYERVYHHKKLDHFKRRVRDIICTLFDKFMGVLDTYEDQIDYYLADDLFVVRILGKFVGDRKILYFDEEYNLFSDKDKLNKRIVIDFMSTLTDNFVYHACQEFFLPKPLDEP